MLVNSALYSATLFFGSYVFDTDLQKNKSPEDFTSGL